MDSMDGKYSCKTCNKNYSCYKSLWNHNKKFHKVETSQKTHIDSIDQNSSKLTLNKLKCIYCNKILSRKNNLTRHERTCKNKLLEINKIEQLETKINELESKLNKSVINERTTLNYPINNHLIDIIVDKSKAIEDLQTTIQNNENTISNSLIDTKKIPTTLNLNNVIIVSRDEDNYINATQLCQAGNKKFRHWCSLDTTKQLINVLESKTGIPALDLIEINKSGYSWIHPDLAIQLAQWISPIFSLQVSSWIRILFTNGNVYIDDHQKEIRLKDHKIQLLQDAFVKKQQRTNYPERNVIYMLTTEDNKKKRNYTLGKTINLKNRLGNYNKSNEHEVIYYQECENEEDMNVIEIMVLNKLKEYKEKANRDRFILPLEKDISLFTNIIDKTIQAYYSV
jgi:hypothetical protein